MNITGFINRIRTVLGLKQRGFRQFDWIPLMDEGGTALTEPMKQSIWVMRSIKIVSGPIASVPLEFAQRGSDEDYTDESLALWFDFPAVGLDLADVVESFVGWMKLKGEWFAILDDNWLVRFPEARTAWPQFIVARPDRMREVVNGNRLVGWQWTDGNGQSHSLLAEQVIQSKFWNPYNDWRGLAEYDAARMSAETDLTNQQFSKNLAEANGDTGPIISAKGPGLSEAQTKQIVAQLEAKRRATLRGDFVPAFLNGEVSVEDSSIKTPDASMISQRTFDKESIAIAFGVPPSMFTPQASYSIGSASDYFRLIEGTCMPLAKKLENVFSQLAMRMTGKPLMAYFDWDEHSTVQQVRNERLTAAISLWDRGISWKDVNEFLSLGMQEFKGWETGYVSFGLTPIGSPAPSPEDDEMFAETLDDEEDADTNGELEEVKGAIRQRSWAKLLTDGRKPMRLDPPPIPTQEPEECECCGCGDDFEDLPADMDPVQRGIEERRRAAWSSHMAKRKKVIRAFESKFKKLVSEARAEVLANLAKGEKSSAITRAIAGDFMFNFGRWKDRFLGEMRKIAAAALQEAGNQLYDEIGKSDPWKMPMPEAMTFLGQRQNKMVGVAQDVFDRIRNQLDEGFTEGESMKEIADRIRSVSNEISEGRARVVAQTESAAAFGVGRHEAMRSAGIQWKEWLSSRNRRVRPTHVEADRDYDGHPIPFGQPFVVGGYLLQHPGDPSGPPQEVINCHCVQVAAVAPKEEGEE